MPLEIKLTQLVKLFKNGEPFKMSKRSGTFVTLRDVVDHVGSGVTRFHMLTRKNDAQLDFDFDKVLEQSRENPVFYVQYALARVSSVIDKATEAGVLVDNKTLSESNLSLLINEEELALAVKLAEWPRLVKQQLEQMNLIGSRFISMIWLELFTVYGIKVMNCQSCGFCRMI